MWFVDYKLWIGRIVSCFNHGTPIRSDPSSSTRTTIGLPLPPQLELTRGITG